MFCCNCGEKIPNESKFCMFCGAPVPVIRPAPARQPAPNTPAAPAAEEPAGEWEGRAVWEACRREQQRRGNAAPRPTRAEEPTAHLEDELPPIPPEFFEEPPPVPGEPEPAPPKGHRCRRCGIELSEAYLSDLCPDCLYEPDEGFDPLPAEFDAPALDLPDDGKKRRLRRAVPIAILLVAIAAAITLCLLLLPQFFEAGAAKKKPAPSVTASERQDEYQRRAVQYAHEMVKEMAAVPDSVHFDATTRECTVEAGDYTVTEKFERQNAQGEMAASTYIAVLTLSGEDGYEKLMLQVDDTILYDNR